MKKFPILFVCLVMAYATGARERTFTVASPDMTNEVTVRQTDSGFMMQVNHEGKTVCDIRDISMTVDGACWNGAASFRKAVRTSVNRELHPVAPRKFSVLEESYNLLSLEYGDYSFQVRVYDEGAAWRFCGKADREGTIDNESAEFVFDQDCQSYTQLAELVRVPLYGAAGVFPAAGQILADARYGQKRRKQRADFGDRPVRLCRFLSGTDR